MWINNVRLEYRGSKFIAASMLSPGLDDHFVIVKPPELVDRYLSLLEKERPRRIVELGTKNGGSAALMALAAEPELLLAIDLAPDVPALLAEFIDSHGLHDRLVTATGLDQGDRAALTELVDAHRPAEGFDLVVDDASHLLVPTRTSFEVLFPRLRPGGLYVVEDWSTDWAIAKALGELHPGATDLVDRFRNVHNIFYQVLNKPEHGVPDAVNEAIAEAAAARSASTLATPRGFLECVTAAVDRPEISAAFADRDGVRTTTSRPLADLAVELTMITASDTGIVDEVHLDADWLAVRRGHADLSLDGFRLGDAQNDIFGYLT